MGGLIGLVIGPPIGIAACIAIVGALIGNQTGCLLDDLAKLGRPLGIAVLAWKVYDFLTGPPTIPASTNYYLGAFLWAFGSFSTFHSTELSFFRLKKERSD